MIFTRLVCLAFVLLFMSACRQSKPVMAHGKPLSYWVESLQGPDIPLRKKAVQVLGNIGPVDDAVIPSLCTALKDSDAGVRREAVLALVKIGPKAQQALGVLGEMATADRDAKVRADAERAVEVIRQAH